MKGMGNVFISAAVTLFILSCSELQKYERLAERYYEMPRAELAATEKPFTSPSWELFRSKYNEGFYEEALESFEDIPVGSSWYDDARFFRGHIYWHNDLNWKAIDEFKYIVNAPHSRYHDAAQWYLALSYIRVGLPGKAVELLKEISQNSKHPYHPQAQQLLQELES